MDAQTYYKNTEAGQLTTTVTHPAQAAMLIEEGWRELPDIKKLDYDAIELPDLCFAIDAIGLQFKKRKHKDNSISFNNGVEEGRRDAVIEKLAYKTQKELIAIADEIFDHLLGSEGWSRTNLYKAGRENGVNDAKQQNASTFKPVTFDLSNYDKHTLIRLINEASSRLGSTEITQTNLYKCGSAEGIVSLLRSEETRHYAKCAAAVFAADRLFDEYLDNSESDYERTKLYKKGFSDAEATYNAE